MHELGIAAEIAEVCVARAGDALPCKIVVEVGRLSAILPEALAFAWQATIHESTLEHCELEIIVCAGAELQIRNMEIVQ